MLVFRRVGIRVAAAVGPPDPHAGEVPIAYVQLQENADLSEAQIVEYLKSEIGERAAIPKEIYIVDEIPLTPVGKIFKPSLRWQAIQRVYEAELEVLADTVESVEISVNEDKIHGSIAEINIKAGPGISADEIKQSVENILARYTVKYKLDIG